MTSASGESGAPNLVLESNYHGNHHEIGIQAPSICMHALAFFEVSESRAGNPHIDHRAAAPSMVNLDAVRKSGMGRFFATRDRRSDIGCPIYRYR